MNGQLNAEQIFVYLQQDSDGTEGIIALRTPTGWMPMVGINIEKSASYEPLAQEIADATKRPVMFVKFSNRENQKVIAPNRMADDSRAISLDEKSGIVAIMGNAPEIKKNCQPEPPPEGKMHANPEVAFWMEAFANFRRQLREALFEKGIFTNPGSDDDELIEMVRNLNEVKVGREKKPMGPQITHANGGFGLPSTSEGIGYRPWPKKVQDHYEAMEAEFGRYKVEHP